VPSAAISLVFPGVPSDDHSSLELFVRFPSTRSTRKYSRLPVATRSTMSMELELGAGGAKLPSVTGASPVLAMNSIVAVVL